MAKGATRTSKRGATTRKTPAKPKQYPEGYGALRGQFVVRSGLDFTKPIFEQVLELDRKERLGERQPL